MNLFQLLMSLVGFWFLLTSAVSGAEANLRFGTPMTRGSGCPEGTTSITMTEDLSAVSLLFDRFGVIVGGDGKLRRDRSKCQVIIPVEVPSGMQFSMTHVDYRGFNVLPQNARSALITEMRVRTRRGVQQPYYKKSIFYGPLSEDYTIQETVQTEWSGCGGSTYVMFATSIKIGTNREMDPAEAGVDSVDISTDRAQLHYQLRPCQMEHPRRGRR